MREFEIEDVRREGLRILAAVHSFCVEHNLRYSLFYGSLLGAIRHNGYIPWDDDIDIAMPRDDYETLVSSFGDSDFGIKAWNADKDYYLPYAKAYSKNTIKVEPIVLPNSFEIGFNIDIFPLDYFPGVEEFHRAKRKERLLLKKYELSIVPTNCSGIKAKLKGVVRLPFKNKTNHYSRLVDRWFIKHNPKNERTVLVGNETNGLKTDLVFHPDIFDSLVLHKFEDQEFFISSEFDHILTQRYGNYMKLPPVEQRVAHHSFKAFYK